MTFPSPLVVLPKEGRSISEKSVRTLRVMPGMAVVELRIIWPFLLRRLRLGISDWCRMNRRVSRRAESISSAESGFLSSRRMGPEAASVSTFSVMAV